ncbi:flavin-containing monooxygenase [Pelagibius marinus]|uniref:flavin-containing monooxygenase n=1 Tax=Pelagibius marinus TaxID=2762760 RepID=UPI001872193D|nr:NAD(P)/FAD-dependent oxidoreductase [Pelagibius marinus]
MSNRTQPRGEVIVIGAGAAGLAAAQALQQRGIAVRVLEASDRVAEAWRHRHPHLRLNTHRWLSSLPGMKLPRSAGAFPDRDSLIRYLENYAARFDLPIDFGVRVEGIERDGDGWLLQTSRGSEAARQVVVATGENRVPRLPDWPGASDFRGEILHSADFGPRERYRGKRVLVVGAGNSGTDALNHLSRVETGQLWVSLRHGPVIFPTRMLGFPIQLTGPLMERLPLATVDRLLVITERLAFGRLSRWGLRRHPVGAATRMATTGTAPAIDNGFIAALKAGKVEVVPEIEAFEPEGVRLIDGRRLTPDMVVAATGYGTGLEKLLGPLGVLDGRGVPLVNGAETVPGCPGLRFTGMRPYLGGYLRDAGRAGKAIAAAIEAELARRPRAEARDLSQPRQAGEAA